MAHTRSARLSLLVEGPTRQGSFPADTLAMGLSPSLTVRQLPGLRHSDHDLVSEIEPSLHLCCCLPVLAHGPLRSLGHHLRASSILCPEVGLISPKHIPHHSDPWLGSLPHLRLPRREIETPLLDDRSLLSPDSRTLSLPQVCSSPNIHVSNTHCSTPETVSVSFHQLTVMEQ